MNDDGCVSDFFDGDSLGCVSDYDDVGRDCGFCDDRETVIVSAVDVMIHWVGVRCRVGGQ